VFRFFPFCLIVRCCLAWCILHGNAEGCEDHVRNDRAKRTPSQSASDKDGSDTSPPLSKSSKSRARGGLVTSLRSLVSFSFVSGSQKIPATQHYYRTSSNNILQLRLQPTAWPSSIRFQRALELVAFASASALLPPTLPSIDSRLAANDGAPSGLASFGFWVPKHAEQKASPEGRTEFIK
jgi:hypothetical protein